MIKVREFFSRNFKYEMRPSWSSQERPLRVVSEKKMGLCLVSFGPNVLKLNKDLIYGVKTLELKSH